MSGDERFDRELRSVLHDLASDPAPQRLVEQVASIPSHARGLTPRRSFMRVASALAAAAVIVIVAGVVFLTRPGGTPSVGGQPPASSSPAAVVASPVAPSSPPSVAPSAVASAGPVGGAVPSGFQAVSVTFASPDLGWVLGTATCSTPPCTSIVRTNDAGRTWTGIPAPSTPISQTPTQAGGTPGVSQLRFADPLDGWAFGPDLWATHDGGATWHRVSISGMSGAPVVALEAANGKVYAVVYETATQTAVRIASSPVGSDSWTLSPTKVQIGAGPVPSTQLVLSGAGGWLVQIDRTVVGGARLVNGEWSAWTPPCATVNGPAVLAASSSTDLVAACAVGQWSTPKGEHLYVSHDGGTTFTEAAAQVPLTDAAAIGSPGAGSILVAGQTTQAAAIVGSFDGGQTWQTVMTAGSPGGQAASPTYLGFTTPTQGVSITQSGTGTGGQTSVGKLLVTRDGGHTWSEVAFGS
jgi:hypothetical protein